MSGTDVATYHRDKPGMSALALEDGVVYHTYSAYARTRRSLGHVSIARHEGATRRGSASAAATSTTSADCGPASCN